MGDTATPFEGLSSLVELSGISVPARARFVGEALVSSTLSSITLGLSCGMVGAIFPVGPLLPFMVGSWCGYSFGLVNHWQTSKGVALHYARSYPTLLAHALTSDRFAGTVPPQVVEASEKALMLLQNINEKVDGDTIVERNDDEMKMEIKSLVSSSISAPISISGTSSAAITLEEWILQGGWGRLSWSILAAQACRADVEDLQRQARQKLIDQHAERYR